MNQEEPTQKKLQSLEEATRCEGYSVSNLKEDINNFLWPRLPGHITLQRAEDFAIAIFNIIYPVMGG